jgi:hypothetical protein
VVKRVHSTKVVRVHIYQLDGVLPVVAVVGTVVVVVVVKVVIMAPVVVVPVLRASPVRVVC